MNDIFKLLKLQKDSSRKLSSVEALVKGLDDETFAKSYCRWIQGLQLSGPNQLKDGTQPTELRPTTANPFDINGDESVLRFLNNHQKLCWQELSGKQFSGTRNTLFPQVREKIRLLVKGKIPQGLAQHGPQFATIRPLFVSPCYKLSGNSGYHSLYIELGDKLSGRYAVTPLGLSAPFQESIGMQVHFTVGKHTLQIEELIPILSDKAAREDLLLLDNMEQNKIPVFESALRPLFALKVFQELRRLMVVDKDAKDFSFGINFEKMEIIAKRKNVANLHDTRSVIVTLDRNTGRLSALTR